MRPSPTTTNKNMPVHHSPPKPYIHEGPNVGYAYLQVSPYDKLFPELNTREPTCNDFPVLVLTPTPATPPRAWEPPPKVYKVRFHTNLGMVVVSNMSWMVKLLDRQKTITPQAAQSLKVNPSGIFVCTDYLGKNAITYLLRPQRVVLSFEPVIH